MNLEGMSVNFLGDSITEGHGPTSIENCYTNILKRECGLKEIYVDGIGGTRIAHQSVASAVPMKDLYFCARAYRLNRDADLTIVFGGTNDYGSGNAPFGTKEDKTPDTFCGAVDFLMNLFLSRYPGMRIVFLTPTRRKGDMLASEDARKFTACKETEKDFIARPLKEYVDVIVEKGKQYNIEVYNLYDDLPINPNIEEDYKRYTTDGIHLNNLGHEVLADYLKKVL